MSIDLVFLDPARLTDMHARELVELAAVVSAQGPRLIRATRQLSETSVEQYWAGSKCRLDRWGRSLKSIAGQAAPSDAEGRRACWPYVRGVLEEILTGEILTRVWTAVLCGFDRHHGSDLAEPLARSVLIAHMEARHRVLTLLVRGRALDAEWAMKLNRLRRRCERWTDFLVGYLCGWDDLSEFAVDPGRAKDFAEDLRHQGKLGGGQHAWSLTLTSLQAAFRRGLCRVSPNADLNHTIASSILACFPPELFDSTGLFHSLWMTRLYNVTNDAQGMLEELLTPERAPPEKARPVGRLRNRMRRFGR